jgi:ornithine cyclodeaminase/alanine dehydrogenase-like protein (mu-crystallin family)
MTIRVLTGDQVAGLLSMDQAIRLMRQGFGALSSGRAVMPMRSRLDMECGDAHLMPASMDGTGLCVKIVTTYPGNCELGLPVVQGMLLVFDPQTGTPRALMDCRRLTAIRTGAGGGLAVDLLSRPDSRVLGLIGAGVQAQMQLRAALCVRPFDRVVVYDSFPGKARALQGKLVAEERLPAVDVAESVAEVVRQADVLITATTSRTPTFDGRAVRPGTHINAIGVYTPDRREVDEHVVSRAYVVVDCRQAAEHEAGDLILAGRAPDAELGEVVNGTAPGRSDDRQITLFKSVGVAVQDAVAAGWVLNQAEQQGVGVELDL